MKKIKKGFSLIVENEKIISLVLTAISILITIVVAIIFTSKQVSISNKQLELSKKMEQFNKNNSELIYHIEVKKGSEYYKGEILGNKKIRSQNIAVCVDQGAIKRLSILFYKKGKLLKKKKINFTKKYLESEIDSISPITPVVSDVPFARNFNNDMNRSYACDYYFVLIETALDKRELILVSHDLNLDEASIDTMVFSYFDMKLEKEIFANPERENKNEELEYLRSQEFEDFVKLNAMINREN